MSMIFDRSRGALLRVIDIVLAPAKTLQWRS
jgi:hypothetical protein